MSDLLCDNLDVMNSLLAALCDPGRFTPRAPLESLESWQRRAVIEHAAPYIRAAERECIRQLAVQHEATYRPEDPDLPRITGDPDLTKPGPDPLGDPFADLIQEAPDG